MVRVATEIKLVCVGAAMEQWYDMIETKGEIVVRVSEYCDKVVLI